MKSGFAIDVICDVANNLSCVGLQGFLGHGDRFEAEVPQREIRKELGLVAEHTSHRQRTRSPPTACRGPNGRADVEVVA